MLGMAAILVVYPSLANVMRTIFQYSQALPLISDSANLHSKYELLATFYNDVFTGASSLRELRYSHRLNEAMPIRSKRRTIGARQD